MKPLELIINCEPVAKGRPKFAMKNGASWSYTPTRTQEAQEKIQAFLQGRANQFPAHVALKLTAVFYRTKPKWPPTSREDKPFRKPDLDNFLKLLVDAMSMRKLKKRDEVIPLIPIIPEDAQITHIDAKKRWSENGHGYILLRLEEDTEDVDYREAKLPRRQTSQRLRVGAS